MQPPAAYLTQLKMFRAETYLKDRQRAKAEKLYYELWKETPDKIDYLAYIDRSYTADLSKIPNETEQQKAVFIKVLYTRKVLEKETNPELLFFRRRELEKIYNEMFFRQMNAFPMLSPDGKRSTISILEIRELLNQLPEKMDG